MTLVKNGARVLAMVGLSMVPPGHIPADIVQAGVPRIEVRAGKTRVYLTPAMTRALVAYDASFRPWDYGDYADWVRRSSPPSPNEALSVLVGDFNGDGQPDVVMAGRRGSAGVLAAILSDSSTTRFLRLHTDAISEIYEEKGSSLCVFADGRFWWLAFGD